MEGYDATTAEVLLRQRMEQRVPLLRLPQDGDMIRAIPDGEMIDRLKLAGRTTEDMAQLLGLDRWTYDNAMTLGFYALKHDEPEKTLDKWLQLTEDVIGFYGERMPEWCWYETLDPRRSFELEKEDQMEVFMEAQDYLDIVISKHLDRNGDIDGDAIVEMGFHLSIGLAASCMAYEYRPPMLAECRRLAYWVLYYGQNHCVYQDADSQDNE